MHACLCVGMDVCMHVCMDACVAPKRGVKRQLTHAGDNDVRPLASAAGDDEPGPSSSVVADAICNDIKRHPLAPHSVIRDGPWLKCGNRLCTRKAGVNSARRALVAFIGSACSTSDNGAPQASARYGGGHRLYQSGRLVWCKRCGCYAEDRVVSLKLDCNGPPRPGPKSGPKAAQLARLIDGFHPLTRAALPPPIGSTGR